MAVMAHLNSCLTEAAEDT